MNMKKIVVGLATSILVFHVFLLCGGFIFEREEFVASAWTEYVFTIPLFIRDALIFGGWLDRLCSGSLFLITIIAGVRSAIRNEGTGKIVVCSMKYLLGLFIIYLFIAAVLGVFIGFGRAIIQGGGGFVENFIGLMILCVFFSPAEKIVLILLE